MDNVGSRARSFTEPVTQRVLPVVPLTSLSFDQAFDEKRDHKEDEKGLQHSLAFLVKDNSFMTRCILQLLLSEENLNSRLINSLIDLHGSPTNLFLTCLSLELTQSKDISLLMRGERSVSVCVLQRLWEPLLPTFERICEPLVKLGESLSKKGAVPLLLDNKLEPESMTEKALSVKNKLVHIVKGVLQASLFPIAACVLCYRAVGVLEDSFQQRGSDVMLPNWVAGASLFLRFLVPAVMSGNHDGGKTFLGKFLMKLCSGSSFGTNCSAEVALQETRSLFDSFCQDVQERGKEHQSSSYTPQVVQHFSFSRNADLSEYLSNHQSAFSKLVPAKPDASEQFEWMDRYRQLIVALKGRGSGRREEPNVPRLKMENIEPQSQESYNLSISSFSSAPSRLKREVSSLLKR